MEEIASTSVNEPSVETLYTNLPRIIIYRRVSMTFVTDSTKLTNAKKHVGLLLTAEGKTSYSTHPVKLYLIEGKTLVIVSALAVLSFKESLISVEQLSTKSNCSLMAFATLMFYLLKKEYTYSQDKKVSVSAKMIGGRGSDNFHTLSNECIAGASSLLATPAIIKTPANICLLVFYIELHNTMRHSNRHHYKNSRGNTPTPMDIY